MLSLVDCMAINFSPCGQWSPHHHSLLQDLFFPFCRLGWGTSLAACLAEQTRKTILLETGRLMEMSLCDCLWLLSTGKTPAGPFICLLMATGSSYQLEACMVLTSGHLVAPAGVCPCPHRLHASFSARSWSSLRGWRPLSYLRNKGFSQSQPTAEFNQVRTGARAELAALAGQCT